MFTVYARIFSLEYGNFSHFSYFQIDIEFHRERNRRKSRLEQQGRIYGKIRSNVSIAPSETLLSSSFTIRRSIVKKLDPRSCLSKHQPKHREPLVRQINFRASPMGNWQGELEWIPLMSEILTELLLALGRSNHRCLLAPNSPILRTRNNRV